jgi:flavin reductase
MDRLVGLLKGADRMSEMSEVTARRREEFLAAMAGAVNGVAIVATDGPEGRFGITVSSVSSVSADPPLILACVNRKSVAHPALLRNGVLSVNLLSVAQRGLADTFSGRPAQGVAYEFTKGHWRSGRTGAPLLKAAVAAFDCTLEQAHDAGSHTILVGRVTDVTAWPADPLLYTARAYGRPLRWTDDLGAAKAGDAPRQSTAA